MGTVLFPHHSQAAPYVAASPLKMGSTILNQQQNLSSLHKLLPTKPLPCPSCRTRSSIPGNASFTTPPDTLPSSDVSFDLSSSALILEPIQKEGSDVLFYFLPGAFTESSEYIPILEGIQSKCPFKLWVAILDVGKLLINADMVESSFDGIMERVTKLGFPSGPQGLQNIFAGGHSWGAWESRIFAMKRAKGFIHLACTFHSIPDNLVQYPKPVLTVCGELDGQITLSAVVKHAGEVYAMKQELGDYFVNAIKPVVIVPGMNHAQFSHCIPNRERGDLDALIPNEEAKRLIIELISSFLTLHGSKEPNVEALSVLTDAVRQTAERYGTFWAAIEDQSRGVKQTQLELASVKEDLHIGVVQHEYKDNFIYSKPSIHLPSKHITINTYFSSAGKFNILKNLWVKMKSKEAISIAFKVQEGDHTPQEKVSMGAFFNRKAFTEALALVPDDTRRRFEEHGKKLRFIEDMVISTSAQEWIDSDLIFKEAEDGSGYMDVQSTALISPVQGMPERFAGMHYLKLLTIARAMEWIFMDCYR